MSNSNISRLESNSKFIKNFKLTSTDFKSEPTYFEEHNAPDWLTSCMTVVGSTMDQRWFWTDHVLRLEVGDAVYTDNHEVLRLPDTEVYSDGYRSLTMLQEIQFKSV